MSAMLGARPRVTVDADLIAYYRDASGRGDQFQGLSLVPYAKDVKRLIAETGARTLLDYGCGLGYQYTRVRLHEFWGVPMPALYDPGVAGLEGKPEQRYDGVICSDVMEHVPAELVGNVLDEVFGYATCFVWISVCCRPAKKKFPDGRNLHVTVRPAKWWQERIAQRAGALAYRLVFTP